MATNTTHQQQTWWAEGDTPVHTDSQVAYLVDAHSTLLTMCRYFLLAQNYIYIASWGMTPEIQLVRGADQRAGPERSSVDTQQAALIQPLNDRLRDPRVGLQLMIECAQENLRRFKAKQPLVGHLLPYLTGEEAKQHGLQFHEDHGWVEVPVIA